MVCVCACVCVTRPVTAQAAKKLMKKEFAQILVLEWIKKLDTRVIDRYLETNMGDFDINMHTGKVRGRAKLRRCTRLLLSSQTRNSQRRLGQSGTTVLIAACQADSVDIVKVLLKYGARVNIGNKFSKFTPLMAAARNANFEIIKLLLKAGADPLAKELVRAKHCLWR